MIYISDEKGIMKKEEKDMGEKFVEEGRGILTKAGRKGRFLFS